MAELGIGKIDLDYGGIVRLPRVVEYPGRAFSVQIEHLQMLVRRARGQLAAVVEFASIDVFIYSVAKLCISAQDQIQPEESLAVRSSSSAADFEVSPSPLSPFRWGDLKIWVFALSSSSSSVSSSVSSFSALRRLSKDKSGGFCNPTGRGGEGDCEPEYLTGEESDIRDMMASCSSLLSEAERRWLAGGSIDRESMVRFGRSGESALYKADSADPCLLASSSSFSFDVLRRTGIAWSVFMFQKLSCCFLSSGVSIFRDFSSSRFFSSSEIDLADHPCWIFTLA
ncbi:hypothetical protein OGATHE_006127 [Ogataea polymorpha]|uniref:Uncharacterized protein n=1 Tax=Ogataea polymorpha TaxID=460523 RepID=A0A9P8NR38_9ASCO|nr:hypothetical protein OGATHE_006127 [Ogataea polymorpha]